MNKRDEKDAFIEYLLGKQSYQISPWVSCSPNTFEEVPLKRKEPVMEKCPDCKRETLEPTILGKGKVCTSCGFIEMGIGDKLFRMISRDTEADDNLELGLIMALKVKG